MSVIDSLSDERNYLISDRRRYRRIGYLNSIEHLEQLNVPFIEELKREVATIYNNEEKNPNSSYPIDRYVNAFRAIIYKGGLRYPINFKREFEQSKLNTYMDYEDFDEVLIDILKDYLREPRRINNRVPVETYINLKLQDILELEDDNWERFTEYIGREFTERAEYEDDDDELPEVNEVGNDVKEWIREVRLNEPVWFGLNHILTNDIYYGE